MTVKAIVLFSGGLDSMLASRVLMDQGITVQAVKFVSPFFGYDLLSDEQGYARRVRDMYGIDVMLRDVSEPYLAMLKDPPHGYGKHFNPCIDCKILLLTEARRIMEETGASFLATGEVLGQRPMSQRRDALRIIERDSGCDGILLRPLCARNLPPTVPEEQGLVDRERLYDFKGRSRQGQMALAARFGITDYPSPAGGCSLTDPQLGARIERFHAEYPQVTVADARLLLAGRHFRLPGGGWLVLGRNRQENERLATLATASDRLVRNSSRPGPLGILRYATDRQDIELAAAIVVRYSRKEEGDPTAVVSVSRAEECEEIETGPVTDADIETLRR